MIRHDPLGWNEEMRLRHEIRSRDVPPSDDPDNPDIYQFNLGVNGDISFKVKRSRFDAWNSIYTFTGEEELRRKFFYPYLPCNFIDIGCAFGSWTLPALARGSTVYGFEPDRRYLKDLVETTNINNFVGNFYWFSMAVFSQSDVIIQDLGELQNIETISIDDFVEWNNLKPEYIKIDVEGLEQHVINGALKTLKRYRPRVLVENHLWIDATVSSESVMALWIKWKMEEIGFVYKNAGMIGKDVAYSFFTN